VKDAILCALAELASELGAGGVVTAIAIVSAVVAALVIFVRWLPRGKHDTAAPGPPWVAAVLVACGLYLLARLVDPLLMSQGEVPPGFDAADWGRVSWFEQRLFGGRWAYPLMPLEDLPALGILVHSAFWGLVVVLLKLVIERLPNGIHLRGIEASYGSPEQELPWYFRWTGATTARRADDRFAAWSKRLLVLLVPLHMTAASLLAAGGRHAPRHVSCGELLGGAALPIPEDAAPLEEVEEEDWPFAAGAWVLGWFLIMAWTMHLAIEGRPPKEEEPEEEDEEEAELDGPPPDPLARLGQAVQALRPGAMLEALEREAPREARTAALPDELGPVVRELARTLTGTEELWSHQREVLDHLAETWRLEGATRRGPTPSLEEEVMRSPIAREDDTPHALVLAAEGAGRTTLGLLAALHVHFDRGATTLAVLPDRGAARAWAKRLREGLTGSSARWNVLVSIAGDDLGSALLGDKVPAVVVCDVETFEEVLADPRTDELLARLGLVLVDDLDDVVGVAEMHLHAAMRRLWALLDTRGERASYPLALLAIAGPASEGTGLGSWARHVLAAPLKVFEGDGAPRAPQVVLRRRDLVDAQGRDLPLSLLAEACDRAGVPWHMRTAGDGQRGVRRAEIDLGRLRRHHVEDPRDAEVVLLEGRYPEVRREAERLAHAGVSSREEDAACVLVLAPPADEEMVLHEEADDAPHAELVASLPRAVTLAEPDVVRQRHFERALGREHDVAALEARFGRRFVQDALDRMRRARKVRERTVWSFDARRDDATERELVRAVREAALGEPIVAACVSDSSERVRIVDEGTSEVLLEVDRAVAMARYPAGRVFLHPRGRYQVVGAGDDALTLLADHARAPCRTTLDREVRVTLPEDVRWTTRQLGGERAKMTLARAEVEERVLGVRVYGPGSVLQTRRRYDAPVTTRYATDVCLLSLALRGHHEGSEASEAPGRAAEVPLSAALRMMLPCALRGADELVDVALVDLGGPHLAFFDRTPGSSGYAEALAEGGLRDLLRLARLVLERLVGSESARLRRLHDSTPDGDAIPWDVAGALTFLDRALEPPPTPEEEGARIDYVPGEGQAGDLGRLWVSVSGRTDDLVWTRHAWRTKTPIGGRTGEVFFDVAVERRAILAAVNEAAAAGAATEPAEPARDLSWGAVHLPALSTAAADLRPLRAQLAALGASTKHVLEMIAAMPLRAEPVCVAERAPLTVLARRRADADAKVLLAHALTDVDAVTTPEGIYVKHEGAVWDLRGPALRRMEVTAIPVTFEPVEAASDRPQ